MELCSQTGDKAAYYYLGQQFTKAGRADDAVHCFTQAGSYGYAIRVCKVLHLCCSFFHCFTLMLLLSFIIKIVGKMHTVCNGR